MTRPRARTALKRALNNDSSLHQAVRDGLSAVKTSHRAYFDKVIRSTFGDSLDLDEAMRVGHEQENRWDYLLSHVPSDEVVAVEPHSAKQDEISTIIKKLSAAREHLKPHLRTGGRVSRWLWVASGDVQFANTEKATLRLAQSGIQFVGRIVRAKHLGEDVKTAAPAPRRRR